MEQQYSLKKAYSAHDAYNLHFSSRFSDFYFQFWAIQYLSSKANSFVFFLNDFLIITFGVFPSAIVGLKVDFTGINSAFPI